MKLTKLTQVLDKLDNKKIILIIIVSLFIFYLDYLIIRWQAKGVKAKYSEIVKLKKDMDIAEKELLAMKNAGVRDAVIVKEIVTEEQITSLLQNISNLANKNNVKIEQIKPAKELEGKEKVQAAGQSFSSMGIILELQANYFSLINFIKELENDKILYALQSIRITSSPLDYMRQNINMALKSYVKK